MYMHVLDEEEFIINFLADHAFIGEAACLNLKELNLPPFVKEFKEPAHWLCRILKYNETKKRLFAEILEYHHEHAEFLPVQEEEKELFNQIQEIDFRAINTNKLLITSSGIREVNSFISKHTKSPVRNTEIEAEEIISTIDQLLLNHRSIAPTLEDAISIEIHSECQVAWKDLKFDFGVVHVPCKVKQLKTMVEAKIYNENLRVEFDAIKNYFGKILAVKKIRIKLDIVMVQGEINKISATSPDIERINSSIIESIKFELIKGLPKRKFISPVDKSLFTMDEYFQHAIDPALNANTFYKKESQLIDDLLSVSNSKHYKNLRFLSEHHAHQIMKLRFILKPFSFVFLLVGERAYHIIWETLDTEEATYVWHADKEINELKRALSHVEAIINTVKVQGKIAYIQSSTDHFHRIAHDYSPMVDGFVKWKGELENILY